MAKLSFNKLGISSSKIQDVKILEVNKQKIEIKQYLPVREKLDLISKVISLSFDENNYINPVKIDVFTAMEIIKFYTNITFTEKQKEDPIKLYDLLVSSKLYYQIIAEMPFAELDYLLNSIQKCIASIEQYKNSAMGILENISTNYDAVDFDLSNIQQKISDPEALATLKELAALSGFIQDEDEI